MTKGYAFRQHKAVILDRIAGRESREFREWSRPPVKGGSGASLYLFTLTGTVSSGSGAATIRNMADNEEIESGATVIDPLGHMDGLTSGHRGICVQAGSAYYAITPYVVDVRWSDPKLEQTKNGSTYTTIDTAEDCS